MRLSASMLICACFLWLQNPTPSPRKVGQPKQQQSAASQQTAGTDNRGTEQSPLVVDIRPSVKTPEESAEDSKEREDKAANDRHIVELTAAIATVAFLQLLVYIYQSIKLRETVKGSTEQSKAMERHIGEAARSADAMEDISQVIQSGNRAIIRAYVSVVLGTAVFQERTDAVKFEGKPTLVNTGSTPARNVKIKIAAEIVPHNQAETFTYTLPQEVAKASAVAAPHQNYILSAIVKDFVPDADVSDIKHGRGGKGALTVWGIVTYDDIFGASHSTKFAQWLFWLPNNTVYGYYIPGQNDMD